MTIKIEYLIIYKIKGNFLDSIQTFNYLLMANSLIKIDDIYLEFNSNKYNYDLITHEINDKQQRLFKLCISTSNINEIENISEVLKIIREFIFKTEGKISIIWDDISNYYSSLAYPPINKIENLLRKLITYFMISNLGVEWSEESTPQEVKNNIKNKRDKNNFLHDTDFIQLADFLFKPYSNKNIEILYKDLKSQSLQEPYDKYLEQFIPKSNWERYFNNVVKCEDGFLIKNWNRLYDLRCLIAHNSFITKNEYEEIIFIVENLTEKFEHAIAAIDEIVIPKEEKEAAIESVLKARNELIEEFFEVWQDINNNIIKLYINKGFTATLEKTLREIIEDLIKGKILTDDFQEKIKPIGLARNKIVNDNDLSDIEIKKATTLAREFYLDEILLNEPFYKI